jgi:hypothetical protein
MKFSIFRIRFLTILLIAALVVISAGAQETSVAESKSKRPKDDYSHEADAVNNPLKPADTSSPRDTLRSFLTDFNFLIDA